MCKRHSWFVIVAALLATGPAAMGQALEAKSRVEAVTLYRDQALVSRSVQADVPAGVSELVVGDLPQRVVPNSLFASAQGDAMVRAVRYRTRAVREEPREEIRALDQQIRKLRDDLRRNEAMRKLVEERRQYLGKLENFTAPTAQVELTKGVLNAKTLRELTMFIFQQRKELTDEQLELEIGRRELTEGISLAERKKAQLSAGSTRTVREAVVFVDQPQAGVVQLRLSYLVTNAGWEPAYNLRAGGDLEQVTVEYNATVHQMSGEDWRDVTLTLSTASPTLMAKGPDLAPFWVALASTPEPQARRELAKQAKAYQDALVRNKFEQQWSQDIVRANDANWRMNVAAGGLQNLELAAASAELRRLQREVLAPTEGLSVTYALRGRVRLDSRSDRQMVQIASLDLDSDFYYVATPLLTPYVYREAEITNDSDVPLLGGPATCYLNGRFVGGSQVPMVAPGQSFASGFGMNSQLRASRELLSKTSTILGGNRQQTFNYRLALENYSDQPVMVRLYDRIPKRMGGADIRLTLGEMEDKLSEDPVYRDREHSQGILRWDVEVAAKASGLKSRRVQYSYTLEFDRKLAIVPLTETGRAAEVEQQFDQMMQRRRGAH